MPADKSEKEEGLQEQYEALLAEHEKLKSQYKLVQNAKRQWEMIVDCVDDMVILADANARILRCNKATAGFLGKTYQELLGEKWPGLIVEHGLEPSDYYGKGHEYVHRASGRWFYVSFYPLSSFDPDNRKMSGHVVKLHDMTSVKRFGDEIQAKSRQLEQALTDLKSAQSQMLQHEKMASIGQLAAGVAHEINNPVGFISSNLSTLGNYVQKLNDYIRFQSGIIKEWNNGETEERVKRQRQTSNLDFVTEDLKDLIEESLEGCDRVKNIVQNLKNFSHVDQAQLQYADMNECMETTLNIVWNELKYKAEVIKEYGELPRTRCYPQQLNQVFMNLLVNAAQALECRGRITIRTWLAEKYICISVTDTGCGIAAKDMSRVFEPFFTTKDVGKGTGLGLSIAYDIVTKNHGGEITVESEPGKGSTFTLRIPVKEGDATQGEVSSQAGPDQTNNCDTK